MHKRFSTYIQSYRSKATVGGGKGSVFNASEATPAAVLTTTGMRTCTSLLQVRYLRSRLAGSITSHGQGRGLPLRSPYGAAMLKVEGLMLRVHGVFASLSVCEVCRANRGSAPTAGGG